MEGTKVDGQRLRRNFRDAAAAEVFRQRLESEMLGLQVHIQRQQASLTEHQLPQVEAAFRVYHPWSLKRPLRSTIPGGTPGSARPFHLTSFFPQETV